MELADHYHFNGLRFNEWNYSRPDGRPSHTHGEIHLIYCLHGVVKEVRNRRTYYRMPSALLFVPGNETHATDFSGEVRSFEMEISSRWMERVRPYFPVIERTTEYQNSLANGIAARIYSEFGKRDSATPLILEGLLLEMLAQIARGATDHAKNCDPRWLQRTQDYLHEHFNENLSIDSIASVAGVHPAHFIRAFRRRKGCTFGEYVRKLRVERASRLLSDSEMPLSQIALESGFADQSHFSRTFKRITGMTPTEYQRNSPSR